MVLLLRILLFALIIFLIYATVKYILNPKRKLELAHDERRYYFLDNRSNVRQNFFITYKGVMFEGEKYLGTTKDAFEVVDVFIWPHKVSALQGLVREDFLLIERKVRESYPNANIDWKSPIHEFMKNKQAPEETFPIK